MGFGVWGLGCTASGLGFSVWGLGFGVGLGLRAKLLFADSFLARETCLGIAASCSHMESCECPTPWSASPKDIVTTTTTTTAATTTTNDDSKPS